MYIFKGIIFLYIFILFTACGGEPTNKIETKLELLKDTRELKTITLNGEDTYYLNINEIYKDLGATAKNDVGEDISSLITVSTTTIDTSKTGKQTIKYSITDESGETTTIKRRIIINNIVNSGQGVHINEFLAANSYTSIDPDFGQFSDWIELYNYSNQEIDIGGYHLSDDKKSLDKYPIPKGTTIPSHGYKIIWADKKNSDKKDIHTNFKLSAKNDSIIFSDAGLNIIDDITFIKQKSDISASFVDGKMLFFNPTLKSANKNPNSSSKKSKKPDFSIDSGFYANTQTLTLTQKNGGAIYYTTDGSIPTKNSTIYSSPISVSKTTAIRARGLEDGKFLSSITNHTYLINENITLPVVSIAIDDKYLYDDKIGIYVLGTDKSGKTNPIPVYEGGLESANYMQRWMRPASIEYIKDGKSQVSENIGIRISGARSRTNPQKSFAIFTKDKFGAKSITYPLFEDKPNIKKIKSFVLRDSGNDWEWTMLRDGLFQTVAKDIKNINHVSYNPTVVFLNGNYWGILNLREKPNEAYLEANYGVNSKKIDLLVGSEKVASGDDTSYQNLLNYIENNDLSNEESYNYVKNQIDIDELINYEIMEIFIANTDWPQRNMKFWKERSVSGKWRWLLYDTDFGFGTMIDDNVNIDTFSLAKKHSENIIYNKLLDNKTFRNKFTSRFTTYLNTIFLPENINKKITTLKTKIEPEIKRHYDFWSNSQWTKASKLAWIDSSNWEESVQKLYSYSNKRNAIVRALLKDSFSLHGSKNLTIPLAQNGKIYIDGIELTKNYNGDYFKKSKITLKAIPKQGHQFIKWSNGQTTPEININISNDTLLEAIFQ